MKQVWTYRSINLDGEIFCNIFDTIHIDGIPGTVYDVKGKEMKVHYYDSENKIVAETSCMAIKP